MQYIPNQLVKIAQTVSPYLTLQHVKVGMPSACLSWHVQLLDPPTQMSKNYFKPYSHINVKKVNKLRIN